MDLPMWRRTIRAALTAILSYLLGDPRRKQYKPTGVHYSQVILGIYREQYKYIRRKECKSQALTGQ
jgi:hypothetical protein